ncbi:Mrp/NBP35 family ATP-binding protein [Ancylobacter dichloromethanicus]|uniref:Iron-sulfur cluster carrier protein n=1 Tax=Ancylobacter dichloromethanicus TaxID=518825 RepID=A0A9W6J6X0_9HYPH|nr:Mrp/NBP35 family ATP-binding protein [Ancylobacter dichloromethanicus]MBS7553004.1 Mrp/NBP35 family ATP-binding protein [Ancylobacter dichloromethanicus]GLK70325.1 iron-sulfur cluster carrier protein [Ancylobacter dichloromethanicus]
MATADDVKARLAQVSAPDGRPVTEAGVLSEILVSDGKVYMSITVDAGEAQAWEPVRAAVERTVRGTPGVTSALVALTAERKAGAAPAGGAQPVRVSGQGGGHSHAGHAHAGHSHAAPGQPPADPQKETPGLPGVGAIIAVASGKGGVGKSTLAANLALGLAASGLRIGLLDADIYGPSVPRLMGLKGRPEVNGRMITPMQAFGLKVMSIGFLVEEETPMIWRGPMVMSAISQMLKEVNWAPLDILVVDMPPGTGDAQLTMAQQVPLAGAVIVSTPQDLALIDARRGIAMFQKVNVPVLGVVENMSYFMCPHCGTRSDVFGHGGARHEAQRLGVPFLGEVPLQMSIRETSDAGLPVVATRPDSPEAGIYRGIAAAVRDSLAGRRGTARAAPRIVMEG